MFVENNKLLFVSGSLVCTFFLWENLNRLSSPPTYNKLDEKLVGPSSLRGKRGETTQENQGNVIEILHVSLALSQSGCDV